MKIVILLIYLAWPGQGNKTISSEFETMDECLSILEKTIVHTPHAAAENEWIAVATCQYIDK